MGLNFPEIAGALDLKRVDLVPAVVAGGATLLLVAALLTRRRRGLILTLFAFLLRGAAFAVLALLLLDPVERIEERHPGSLLLAVDMSRSVDAGARSEAWNALRNRATGDLPPTAVGFGAYVRPLDPSARLPSGPAADDLVSDPGPALDALLLREDAGGGAARLVVATDGAVALVDESLPAASELSPLLLALVAGAGMRVQAVGLELTDPPVPGQPVRLMWRGTSSAAGNAVLVAHVNGQQVRRVPVSIDPGAVEIPVTMPPLPPGHHVIGVRVDVDGDEPLDNAAVTEMSVEGPPTVTLIADAERPLVLSALRAQGLEVDRIAPAALVADPGIVGGAGVIVLDRVAVSTLSDPGLLRVLTQKVKGGAGLLYLPREDVGEMYDVRTRPFLDLLPLLGQSPPPAPEEDKPPKPPDPNPGLKPPDPEKPHKREMRKAPSLGLLLLVDSSSSMKGSKLRLAKEAAIAAAEVLHPKDLVGLVQFNHLPSLVLDLTPAGDKAEIIDRVSRVKATGGTRFGPALRYALEVFEAQDLAIRHVILLSDGESRPFRAKPLVSEMAEKGITVSTVGCGGSFDEVMLSDIAQWGQGRFHPAFNANEVPQIFTIEAERVIKATGARHRRDAQPKPPDPPKPAPGKPVESPKPPEKKPEEKPAAIPFRLGLPSPYLGGIGPHDVPGLLGLHATRARPGAWVSLETEDKKAPVLAHWALGYGRVAAFALPLEGGWAAHVVGWNDYQTLLSQLVRFLHADASPRRFHVNVHPRGRSVLAT
ncbi:MAG: VWA domain-containing protein, partial [Planctomycetes bacterium]|nr:VWA domain-containing protein [Planctomycetota bacterium]